MDLAPTAASVLNCTELGGGGGGGGGGGAHSIIRFYTHSFTRLNILGKGSKERRAWGGGGGGGGGQGYKWVGGQAQPVRPETLLGKRRVFRLQTVAYYGPDCTSCNQV